MVFYTTFNRYFSRITATDHIVHVLGWALKCLAQGHSHEKTQRIQYSSNPGPLDYESNTLPLSHAGPSSSLEENIVGKGENAGNAF